MSAIRSERGVMVPLRQLVPLPNTTITVDIGRELSKRAVDAARAVIGVIFLFTQIHPDVETPDMESLFPIGVRAEATKLEKMLDTCRRARFDCLVILGGNGTHKTANLLSEHGIPVVTLPKTIANDLETIQSEGHDAVRKVDANMVV